MEITQNEFQTDIKLAEGETLPAGYTDIPECNVTLDHVFLDLKLSEEQAKMLNNGIRVRYKLNNIPAAKSATVSIIIDKESTYGSK